MRTRPVRIFSLGAALACVWRPAYPLLPWAFTAAMLTVAAMWDHWTRGGAIDFIILGLAAFELMLGLLETDAAGRPVPVRTRGAAPPSRASSTARASSGPAED